MTEVMRLSTRNGFIHLRSMGISNIKGSETKPWVIIYNVLPNKKRFPSAQNLFQKMFTYMFHPNITKSTKHHGRPTNHMLKTHFSTNSLCQIPYALSGTFRTNSSTSYSSSSSVSTVSSKSLPILSGMSSGCWKSSTMSSHRRWK